jgi:hypothetical protein
MAEEVPFTLPKEFLNPLYAKVSFALLAGFLVPALVIPYLRTFVPVAIAALVFLIVGLLYLYTLRYKYVYVSVSHLRGKSYFPKRPVLIAWTDEITVVKRNTEEGINGYELQTSESKYPLFLPEAIAHHPNFRAVVARYAPPSHVLFSLSKKPLT